MPLHGPALSVTVDGVLLPATDEVNFVSGVDVTITGADDPDTDSVTLTFDLATTSGGATTPTQRASATSTAGTGTSLTVNKPTGTVDGDVMLAFVANDGTDAAVTAAPSGWTLLSGPHVTDHTGWLYSKVASSEGASYTWTMTSSGTKSCGGIVSYSACSAASPIGPVVTATGGGSGGTTGEFGNTTPKANTRTLNLANKYAAKVTTPAGTVLCTSISAYVRGTGIQSATCRLQAAIYTDSAGVPGTKVAETTEITVAGNISAGWQLIPFASAVSLTASTTYWLVIDNSGNGTSNVIDIFDTTTGGTNQNKFMSSAYTGTFPTTWVNGGNVDFDMNLKAAYTTSVAGNTIDTTSVDTASDNSVVVNFFSVDDEASGSWTSNAGNLIFDINTGSTVFLGCAAFEELIATATTGITRTGTYSTNHLNLGAITVVLNPGP